jgi:uncharacterized membrane-anchored protein
MKRCSKLEKCTVTGIVKLDIRTKSLLTRIKPGEIAVIDHEDLDWMAAEGLVRARVGAVLNCSDSISGRFGHEGPTVLLKAGIPVIDCCGKRLFQELQEGMVVRIEGEEVYVQSRLICRGRLLNPAIIEERLQYARQHVKDALLSFVENTLQYASSEKQYFFGDLSFPQLRVPIRNRHVLVVARGKNYYEDLRAIRSYIKEVRPVLIAVDGGADALLSMGLKPDVIVGDMDSVSDQALRAVEERVVHAYLDGCAPGLARLQEMQLQAHICRAPGTSEDIAMLMADQAGASLIVAVGTHTNMVDFFEKGRKGMASTLLTRLRIGGKLVDAKGVSQLYHANVGVVSLLLVCFATFLPLTILAWVNPVARHVFHLLYLQVKLVMPDL